MNAPWITGLIGVAGILFFSGALFAGMSALDRKDEGDENGFARAAVGTFAMLAASAACVAAAFARAGVI